MRRDECGAWRIKGKAGSIYTGGDGRTWTMHVACRSARHWSDVRAKLAAFCTIAQDGDDEGVARLHGLPPPEHVEVIREALGIRKRVAVFIGHRERLRHIGFRSRPQEMPTLAARIGGDGVA